MANIFAIGASYCSLNGLASIFKINHPCSLSDIKVYTKESVELTFVYLIEGCGKTLSEINDTIPHTVVDMEYQGAECTYPMYLHEVSVVTRHPSDKKTTTFSIKDLRKTLSQICNTKRLNRLAIQK